MIPPSDSTVINPAFAEYISSYTAGVLPSASGLRISFSREVVDSTEAGKESPIKLFDFSTAIKGKVFWVDSMSVKGEGGEQMIFDSRGTLAGMNDRVEVEVTKQ